MDIKCFFLTFEVGNFCFNIKFIITSYFIQNKDENVQRFALSAITGELLERDSFGILYIGEHIVKIKRERKRESERERERGKKEREREREREIGREKERESNK